MRYRIAEHNSAEPHISKQGIEQIRHQLLLELQTTKGNCSWYELAKSLGSECCGETAKVRHENQPRKGERFLSIAMRGARPVRVQ